MSSLYGHDFYTYILPCDLHLLEEAFKTEGLFINVYGYPVTPTSSALIYSISQEKQEVRLCPYKVEVETQGAFWGYYFVRWSWAGERDASHIINFKNKYKLTLGFLGHSPDWLGYPICLLYSEMTKAEAKKRIKEMKAEQGNL